MKIKNRRIISLVVCIGIILAGSAFAIENDGNMEFDTYNYVLYDTYEGTEITISLFQCPSCGDLYTENSGLDLIELKLTLKLAWPSGIDIMYELERMTYELCSLCGWENIVSYLNNYWENYYSSLPMGDHADCCDFSMLCLGESIADEESAVTRNLLCPHYDNCRGVLGQVVTYGGWLLTNNQRYCIHRPLGVDVEQYRNVSVRMQCNRCIYGYHQSSYTEFRWDCRGFN